jgi:UDP-arabinose 4-epimerase
MAAILVTGGAGYIGAHVCKALARAGHVPIAFDNLARGNRAQVQWGPLENGDVLDAERLTEVLRTHQVAAVMHLAAYAFIDESIAQPELYRRNNIEGTRVLLAAMAAAGVPRVVASSSCAVYPPTLEPVDESVTPAPADPYGESKVEMEQLLSGSGCAWVALRFFNAAGADPDGDIGEYNPAGKRLIPNLLAAARAGRPFTIHGADYPTPDGTCIRDFVHVSDIAAAHLLALAYLDRASHTGRIFNLGTGTGVSIREVLAAVASVTGRHIAAIDAPRRPGDAPYRVAAADAARRVLGWSPRWPALADMVAHAWAWEQSR